MWYLSIPPTNEFVGFLERTACDWVLILLRMYYLYAKKNGLQTELLDSDPYEPSGLRSVVISIKGENAFKFFSIETGVHRLSRVSPYDQADRRQTSRALVVIEPEVAEKTMEFFEKDIEITTCCGSGPGGQNTNKVETVVMIKHIPTDLRVRCQAERSQEANKKIALDMIAAKVMDLQRKQKNEKEAEKRAKLPKADFGERSRTYVLSQHPQVIDHRTGKKTANIKTVLEGNLELVL
jgi:peptide chain release factor 2